LGATPRRKTVHFPDNRQQYQQVANQRNLDDIRYPPGDLVKIKSSLRKNPYHPGVEGLEAIAAAEVRLDQDTYMPVVDLYFDVQPGYRLKRVEAIGIQFSPGAQIRVELEKSPGATGGRTPRSVRVDVLQFKEGKISIPVTDSMAASIVTLSFQAGYRLHG